MEQILKQAWIRAGNMARSPSKLMLCILPNYSVPFYAVIKRVCDTVIDVVTQCVQSKHIFQAKRLYCAILCLKMNVKLDDMNSFVNPQEIIYDLGGVSEGQFYQVFDFEIEAVRRTDACTALEATYKPSITFVVVQRGRHTRLFSKDVRDLDRIGNTLVGTVVESTITHPFEFNLVLGLGIHSQGENWDIISECLDSVSTDVKNAKTNKIILKNKVQNVPDFQIQRSHYNKVEFSFATDTYKHKELSPLKPKFQLIAPDFSDEESSDDKIFSSIGPLATLSPMDINVPNISHPITKLNLATKLDTTTSSQNNLSFQDKTLIQWLKMRKDLILQALNAMFSSDISY
ncbi:13058_t:CDS:2 [Funneliformis mosseae]|uniref:13058_t:CDS:1 n=1 Tax=Funneliformis mosseae TaxID=27381 RepID=A0A9N9CRG1_FUNMO|nr:13058_t:CDS:2 [Funneliformis mosseae]